MQKLSSGVDRSKQTINVGQQTLPFTEVSAGLSTWKKQAIKSPHAGVGDSNDVTARSSTQTRGANTFCVFLSSFFFCSWGINFFFLKLKYIDNNLSLSPLFFASIISLEVSVINLMVAEVSNDFDSEESPLYSNSFKKSFNSLLGIPLCLDVDFFFKSFNSSIYL